MKKSKLLVSLLTAGMVFGVSACGETKDPLANENQDIVAIYNLYKANAEAEGKTPASYEDWLATIKGDKGDPGEPGQPGQPGKDGKSPVVTIGENGNWYIDGVDSGKSSKGVDGQNATAPVITIGENGNWYINGVDSGKTSKGADGQTPAAPVVSIGQNGNWYVDGVDQGVKAVGQDGQTPAAPVIGINLDGNWEIDGVDQGVSAYGNDGEPGTPGAPGAPGAEGRSAFDIFKDNYPHYNGTEADWIKDVTAGYFADNMPRAGHDGDWEYDAEKNAIVRECETCGETEEIAVKLPATIKVDVTPESMEGLFRVDNTSAYPWTYDAATKAWKSSNKGISSSSSILNIYPEKGLTFSYHVHASGEGSGTSLWDYFSGSNGVGINSTLGGTRVGTTSGMDKDVEIEVTDGMAPGASFGLTFSKDSGGNGGDDEAIVTNFICEAPISALAPENVPDVVVVNFVYNNGEADKQQVAYAGSSIDYDAPTRPGYVFEGWFADAAFTVAAPAVAAENCSVYAKWVKTHKVTVVDYENGGDDIVYNVKHNSTLEMEIPESDTELFGGLYVAPACTAGTEFDMNAPIKRDTIVYCKWNEAPEYAGKYGGTNMYGSNFGETNGCELIIKPNGQMSGKYEGTVTGATETELTFTGSTSDKLYVFDDFIIGASDIANDDDIYIFVKGAEKASGTNKFILNTAWKNSQGKSNANKVFSISLNGQTTNYALIEGVIYKNVTVSSLDGDYVIGNAFGTSASSYQKDVVIKDAGGNVLVALVNGVAVDADYGVYTNNQDVLKVYGDGKNASINGVAIEYEKDADTLVVTEYDERKVVSSHSASSSSTMTWDETKGKWIYKQYSYSSGTETIYTDSTIEWRKEDNKFVYGHDIIAGNAIYTLNKVDGTFSVSRPSFTVTMNVAGEATEQVVREGVTYVLPTPEIADNQAFLGWYDNAEFEGEPITEATETDEFFANIVTTYKLTVHKNLTDDATVSEDVIFNAGETMNGPSVMKDGYTFKGWFTDAECTEAYTPAAAAADEEIWAKWEAGKYMNNAANYLDAIDEEGTFIDSINFGTSMVWGTAEKNGQSCICANNAQNTERSEISITAKADFWFSFDYISSSEANYDYLEIYVNDVKVDETKGTGTNSTEGTGSKTVFVNAGDILKLSYKKDSSYYLDNTVYLYNVKMEAPENVNATVHYGYGDPEYEVVSVAKNAAFGIADPVRDGFAFMGWYTDAQCETPFDTSAVVTGDIEIWADWYDLSTAVGTSRAEAVDIDIAGNDDPNYVEVNVCPGQTEIWFKATVTEANKSGTASTPYFYIKTSDNNSFKNNNFVKQETFMNASEEVALTQTSIYGSGYVYAGSCGSSGALSNVGDVMYVKLTLKNITNLTTIRVLFSA